MTPRSLKIGEYDTHEDGRWTMSALNLTEPIPDQNLVRVPGSPKLLDLSAALTEGEPVFGPRTLTATLESSEGTREERQAIIDTMVNTLTGRQWQIVHPDYPDHYLLGWVQIGEPTNDLVHAVLPISATCEAYKYAKTEHVYSFVVVKSATDFILTNEGSQPVVPTVTVGPDGSGAIIFGADRITLTAGTYVLPWLRLEPGDNTVRIRASGEGGTGKLTITYREVVL